MTAVFVHLRLLLVRVGFAVGSRLPLRARVVLATAHDEVLRGNLAIIAAALATEQPAIPVTILAHRPSRGVRGRLANLVQTIRGAYHLGRARVFIVDDYYFPIYPIRPRAGTTIVQVWHACGAFKRFGRSLENKRFGVDRAVRDRVPIHANYDLCLVSSPTAAVHFADAFGQPLDRFVYALGIPRTDVLFGAERIAARNAELRVLYGIPPDRRVILYAPTFRGDRIGDARFNDQLDLGRLRTGLGDDHVVLLRLHPFIREQAVIGPELAGFAIDVSDHPDINELLPLADLLVTDYSSVIFEFALLGRPMVFFAPDHADYELERGFYFDYRAGVPGPVVETTDEVVAAIRADRFDPARMEAFRRTWFEVADGLATDRFIARVVLPALRGQDVPSP